MPIQIEIQETHIQPLVEFYAMRLKTLREEVADREKESREINIIIQKLRKKSLPEPTTDSPIPKAEYHANWPWVKKILFAIELQDRPLTTKEIVDTLTDYESAFLFERKRVVASISSILSMKSGPNKDFVRLENEAGEFIYYINDREKQSATAVLVEDDDLPF